MAASRSEQQWWAQPEPPGSSTKTSDADWVAVGIEDIELKQGSDILINRIPEYFIKDPSRDDFQPKELRVGLYTNTQLNTAAGGLDVFKVMLQRAVARGPGASPPPSPSVALAGADTTQTWQRFCKQLAPDLERAAAAYELSSRPAPPPSPAQRAQAPSLLLALDALFICAFLRSSIEWRCWGYPFRSVFQDSRFEARRFPLYRDLLIVDNQVPMFLLRAVLRYFIRVEDAANRPATSTGASDDEEEGSRTEAVAEETLNSLLMTVVVAVYPFNHGLKLDAGTEGLEKHLAKHFSTGSPDALRKCDHVLAAGYLAICGGLNPRPPEDFESDEEEEEEEEEQMRQGTGGGGDGIRALLISTSRRRLPFLNSLRRRTSSDNTGATSVSTTSEPLLLNGNGHGPAAAAATTASFTGSRNRFRVPSATFLHATYGITFQVSLGSLTMDAIRYDKRARTLHLPTLIINDHTSSLFRNLALYEQLQVPAAYRSDLRTYLYLITCLVDDVQDVRLLTKQGVIVNQLGSDKAVAQLWNGMSQGLFIPSNPPHYWGVLQKSIAQLERAGHSQWFGNMRLQQAGNPLLLLALLLITASSVVQAVLAVLTFRRNPTL